MTQSLAIVTGAASGIGAEVAQRLARRGYGVIAVDRTQELADQAATALGGESIPVACDLSVYGRNQRTCANASLPSGHKIWKFWSAMQG